jgi:hypothetical protein
METFMVTFMVERNSRNLCRRTNHQVRASDNYGPDKAPAQRVHGWHHEGFMVRLVQFGVGPSPSVGLDHENGIVPAQRVHGWHHEGLMVGTGLIGAAESGGTRPRADCQRPHRRRSALGVMGPARRHGWWTPFEPSPVRCHTGTSRQRSLRNTARPRRSPATPAPGSAFMSSFGLRPPFDRWPRCGQCASSD